MQNVSSRAGAILLALALLPAAAPARAASADPAHVPPRQKSASPPAGPLTGLYASYLDGRFAVGQFDMEHAAEAFLRALAIDPGSSELQNQAFLACALAGRPEAVRLAKMLPDNQVARLLLASQDARTGNWEAAEARFQNLPREGMTQLLRPLVMAWAQQGAGKTDAALSALRPFVEGPRFRGIYALHAAMIADMAGRSAEAGRLYRIAQADYGGSNLRLAQVLASWQARQGHPAESQQTLRALLSDAGELSIALPALTAAAAQRPVVRPIDGIAETYLALAAALRAQDNRDSALTLLRLALSVRPDFTAARLLLADLQEAGQHYAAALAALAPVPPDDPLIGVVRLHRAALEEHLGNADDAAHALEQIARDYPTSPLPYAQLGDLLRSKSRFAEAVSAYDRAIARVPAPGDSSWPLFYSRGIAHDRSHDWPNAEADFQRALKLSPDQPYVLNYLAYSWADQGTHLIQARQMLERAAEQRPNDGAIVDSLGWVLLRQGDQLEAVRILERAVELQPEDSSINGHLGDAYMAVGRKLEAEFQWRRALTLSPEPEDVTKLESKLREASSGAGAGGGTDTAGGAATAEHRVQ